MRHGRMTVLSAFHATVQLSAASLVQFLPKIPAGRGGGINNSSPSIISAKVDTHDDTCRAEHNKELNKHTPKDVTNQKPLVLASKQASKNDSVSIKPTKRDTTHSDHTAKTAE